MKHFHKKLIALILSFALLFTSIPLVSYATDDLTSFSSEGATADVEPTATIVDEIVEKRAANEKTFRMSDGTLMTAVYPNTVHYKNNGTFMDINNSIVESTNNGETTLQNTDNDFKIKFSKKATAKKLATMKVDSQKIEWRLQGSKNVIAKIVSEESADKSLTHLENLNGVVVYENILKDTDLKYTVSSSYIKEDIVLKSLNSPVSFSFDYDLNGLYYKINTDGSVAIYNSKNETVFTLDKPYMYDQAGAFSNAVSMDIEETKNGISITLTPDFEWINDQERVFPITIDPTVVSEQSAAAIKDTTGVLAYKTSQLESALELNNNDLYLKVGRFYGTEAYSLIYVPLPTSIVDSSRIIQANMFLYCYRSSLSTCSDELVITAHEVTTDWEQDNISINDVLYYDDLPEYDNTSVDFITLSDASIDAHNQLYSFDITRLAQQWATGESVNRGVLLKGQDLSTTEQYMRFYDSDNAVINSDPCFRYTYRDTKGIEDYWTYTTMSAGKSGTAAVNNFNGNLVVTQNITGIDGNRLPVAITAMYDSSSRSASSYNLGNGWRTNYNMQICTSDFEGYPYYLIDSDGTEHYFFGEDSDSEWKDEDGLGYVLKADSTVYSNGFLITDKNKNKNYFRSDGKIGQIVDTFGNQINISYTVDGKISTITDGAGRVYTFAYNESGLIASITNPAEKVVTFEYTASKNLEKIIYSDNTATTFEYGENGLIKVICPDGTYTKVTYNYVSSHLYTTSLEFYGSNNVLNADYDFTYKHNNTIIQSDCDNTIYHVYQFDNYGKTVNIINKRTNTAEYYNYGAPGGAEGTENQLLSASDTKQTSVNLYNDENPANTSKWYMDPYSTDTVVSVDNSRGRNSAPSLKIQQTNEYGGESSAIYDLGVLSGGYDYCIKVHVNTNGARINTDYGIYSYVYTIDANGERQYLTSSNSILETMENDWLILCASTQLETDTQLYLTVGSYLNSTGVFWIDDIQVAINLVEDAETSEWINLSSNNYVYNYLQNTNFINNGEKWIYKRNGVEASDNTIIWGDGISALVSGEYDEQRSISQTTSCAGEAGDVICFGSWGVGNYVAPTGTTKTGSAGESVFRVRIELTGSEGNAVFADNSNVLNYNYAIDDWQFVSGHVIAPIDFTSVTIYLEYNYNDNYALFAWPFIYKEQFGQTYVYDNNGNIVSTKDLSETEATFAYQDNNLSQMINPTGSRYSYAYDESTNALMYANSSDGQLFSFTYDEYGNVRSSSITAVPNEIQLSANSTYYIRNITTGNVMKALDTALVNGTYAAQNNSIRWKLIATEEAGVYYIQSLGNSEKHLTVENASSADKSKIILADAANSDSQKFKISANSDGSFMLLTKVSNYTKAVDSRDLNNSSSTELNKGMVQNAIDMNSGFQKWYFTLYSESSNASERVNTYAAYTSDGNYISSATDALGNTVSYQFNNDGTISSTTDAKNNFTTYTYYDNGELKSVSDSNTTNTYTYENDLLKTIETSNGNMYTFNYDAFGRRSSIQINRKNSTATPRTLVTYTYNSEAEVGYIPIYGSKNNVSQITYGNGYSKDYYYNINGMLSSSGYMSYAYNRGLLELKNDGNTYNKTLFAYDFANRVVNKTQTGEFNGSIVNSVSYKYIDGKNLLEKYRFSTPRFDLTTGFVYGNINSGELADAVYGVKINDTLRLGYTYDNFARLSTRTLYTNDANISKTYSYKAPSDETTSCVINSITENGYTYNYTYDANGNITGYTKTNIASNSIEESNIYRYDSKNQLIYAGAQETGGIEYTYDAGGNILTKKNQSTNTTINYGYTDPTWADLLTSYNGQAITYDEIGNPLTYNNGTPMALSWVDGRNLESVTIGDNTYYYYYDSEGVRASKSIGETYVAYHIIDGTVYGESRMDSEGVTDIYYFYDDSGNIFGFSYNGTNYYYQFNLQGDVIGIYNANGQLVVEYKYDAWGKVLSVTGVMADTVGTDNPFRYRGYYYDTETGFYLTGTRYYDPEIGRFINADSYIQTPNGDMTSTNMVAYCGNNPVNRYDPNGEAFLTATICGIAVSKIAAAFIGTLFVGAATYAVTDSLVKNPPVLPSISLPKIDIKPKSDSKEKDVAPTLPKPPAKDPVHHIVAKADPRAAESRQILRDVGIEPVTDPRNLVVLPQSYHASLHTTAYHNYITERLRPVAGDKAGVEAALASLKAEILARSAAGIRWN